MTEPLRHWDIILAGGGLANGLIGYRLAQLRPDLRILMLESGPTIGGNHTWSFHATDLTEEQRGWMAPFTAHRWPYYDVVFPGLRRRIDLAYWSVTSDLFHRVLADTAVVVRLDTSIGSVDAQGVTLADGEVLTAGLVLDGRGAQATAHVRLGWQKFLGLEIRTGAPHGLAGPVLMDARVPQIDGYRFLYVLPLGPDRLLIEDTYYADAPDLDHHALSGRIAAYAAEQGWAVAEILREESGVLPITLAGDIDAFWADKQGQPCVGLRAGLFHPTTGYSLPDAVRLADQIAHMPDLAPEPVFAAIRSHAEARWRGQRLFRALNRMLFLAGTPDRRWAVMQRFYRFPEPLIARFYAGHLAPTDKLRLLVGKPPVPVGGALRALADVKVSRSMPPGTRQQGRPA